MRACVRTYVQYVQDGDFKEEMLHCEDLKTTTTPTDIYSLYKHYMYGARIPLTYVILNAADWAPAMIGRQRGVLCLMKADNPDMMTVDCVIHRENLVARNLSLELNEVLLAVIKCINIIESNHGTEPLLTAFCHEMEKSHVRLLLHTEVRWLSKGNDLERFVEMFDTLQAFLTDTEETIMLRRNDGQGNITYLADIFGKLNILNSELQVKNKTLFDAKIKIYGSMSK